MNIYYFSLFTLYFVIEMYNFDSAVGIGRNTNQFTNLHQTFIQTKTKIQAKTQAILQTKTGTQTNQKCAPTPPPPIPFGRKYLR